MISKKYIELAELLFDIATNQENHSFLRLNPRKYWSKGYMGRINVLHTDGKISYDNRFKYNSNIFPSVISETARLINQALHIDNFEFLWWEYDFDKKCIHSSGNSPEIKNRAIDILTYATNNDCLSYDQLWDKDGNIKELIYIEKIDAVRFLDRHNIKHPYGKNEIITRHSNEKILEDAKLFYVRVKKNEHYDEQEITRMLLKNFPNLTPYMIGKIQNPLTEAEKKSSMDEEDCQRARGRRLIKKACSEKKIKS